MSLIASNTLLLGRYRVVRQLGQGGMGAVYEATDERFGSTVALKQTLITEDRLRRAFEREAQLLNRLRHAALPHVFDYFHAGEDQFLVMQYIPGHDLGYQVKQLHRAFDPSLVLTWADQLLDLLDYLHTQDPPIVHRDIKPENLKLSQRGEIILLDFGLAKGSSSNPALTATQSVFGYTPHYAPFEQVRGIGTDPRSDLYSLATTLYHLLSGRVPPDALARAECLLNSQPDPFSNLAQQLPTVPPGVARVLEIALAQRRDDRFPSASSMRSALRSATQSLGPGLATNPSHPAAADASTVRESPGATDLRSDPYGTAVSWGQSTPPTAIPRTEAVPGYSTAPVAGDSRSGEPPRTAYHPGPAISNSHPATTGGGATGSSGMGVAWAVLVGAIFLLVLAVGGIALIAVPYLFEPEVSNANRGSDPDPGKDPVPAEPRAWSLVGNSSVTTPGKVFEVAMSPEGTYFATVGEQPRVEIWNSDGGTLVRSLTGLGAPSRAVAFSPDGRTIAAGSDDGKVTLWSVADGIQLRSFTAHPSFVFILYFAADGETLMTAGGDRSIRFWSVRDGTQQRVVRTPDQSYRIVAVSPNLTRAAFVDSSNLVSLWDLADGSREFDLSGSRDDLRSGAFSQDGASLALGSVDGYVRVWNVERQEFTTEFRASEQRISSLRWRPTGGALAVGTGDGAVALFDPTDASEFSRVARAHAGSIDSIAFRKDGTLGVSGGSDGTARLYSIQPEERRP